VESLFLNLPPKKTAFLKQEFYGPHFSLFARDTQGVPTLELNLKAATTETQKASAIDFVKGILNKGMTKSFYGYTFFQQLIAEYVDVADANDIRSMASTVVDHSIHLLSTRAGTRVVATCASYGTPKDRKRICKSLKGYTCSSLLHRDAYLALLKLIQVTDDSVSIHKSVLNEILTAPKDKHEDDNASNNNFLLNLTLSETGSKLFLMLLVQDDSARMKYFDPYERSILEPVAMIKENGKLVPTSKKDSEVRRKELLKYMEEDLVKLCLENTVALLFSVPGSRVLKEVYASLAPEALGSTVAKFCRKAMDLYKDNPQNEEKLASLFDDPVAHRTIKSLVLHDAESDNPAFTKALVSLPDDGFLDLLNTNRGAFVLSAIFKVSDVRATLNKLRESKARKILKSYYSRAEAKAGYEALLKVLDG
jgi:pumilio homology domain family member 6